MEAINRANYEIYLIDFMEGILSEDQQKEVMLFLEQNPDIAAEFDGLDETILPTPSITFDNKNKLKHKELQSPALITSKNYEEYFIKAVEQDLNTEEKRELLLFLQLHPEFSQDFELLMKTRLQADTTKVFEDHSLLKDIALIPYGNISRENYRELFAAYHEGDLSENQKQDVDAFVTLNPFTQELFAGLKHMRFTPDTSVVFENKSILKKSIAIAPARTSLFRVQRMAVAATIAFALFFSWMYFQQGEPDIEHMPIAQRNSFNHDIPRSFDAHKQNSDQETVNPAFSSKSGQILNTPVVKQQPLIDTAPTTQTSIYNQEMAMELASVEHRTATSIETPYMQPEVLNYCYAPMLTPKETPTNFLQYAALYIKSQRGFLDDLENQARETINSDVMEYKGLDLWDIAEAGVRRYNQFTENDVKLDRLKKPTDKPE